MYIVYIHVHCSTAVCLGVFGGLLPNPYPSLLVMSGGLFFALGGAVVCGNEEADKSH